MNKFLVVLKKELLDIFRDRKTILFTLLLPILIYPLMFSVTTGVMEKSNEEATKNIVVAIEGDNDNKLVDKIKSYDNIKIKEFDNNTEALADGKINLIINIDEEFDKKISSDKKAEVKLLIDDKSTDSSICSSYIRNIINDYSESVLDVRLKKLNLDSSIIHPIEVEEKSGVNENGEVNTEQTIILGMIPALILILLFTPTIGIAADLGAGEKEKYTMEPLLSTAVSRSALLWGKVFSIALILIIILIGSVISLIFSFSFFMKSQESAVTQAGNASFTIDSNASIMIIGFSLLLILVISMLQIGVSMYARSTKEANTYLSGMFMPIVIIVMIPLFLDVRNISFIYYNIPFLNTVCVLKEAFMGIYNTLHIGISLAWNIVYVILTTVFVRKLFSKESIIFRI